MAPDREARIRARAHEIWEKEGRPVGEEQRHWDQASREIDATEAEKGAAKKAPRAKAASAEKAPKAAPKRASKEAGTSGATKTARGKKSA
jgi:Protein of unknown function (DUF2934)